MKTGFRLTFIAAVLHCLLLGGPGSAVALNSICAEVKIEIAQELSLERQAFDAEMRITNGLSNISVDDVGVTISVIDKDGDPVAISYDPNNTTAKFFVRLDTMSDIGDVDGAGVIEPVTTADIHWLLIPAMGSSNGNPLGTAYYVGATLTYSIGGVHFTNVVAPDRIIVKPLPKLKLDYFMPEDVYADDAFTPGFLDPPIPFGLGVRIMNNGTGTAKNVTIESAQPRIIDNEQGLLIGFFIEGTEVNGQSTANTLLVDFGDIAAGGSAVGRWMMTTSLSGMFTQFDASYIHSDELGGKLTSLIEGIATHLFIHDVLADLPGSDGIRDFLASDSGTLTLYESQGVDSPVVNTTATSSLVFAGQNGTEYHYSLSSSIVGGYSFLQIADPYLEAKRIKAVLRSDGKSIGTSNVWLSKRRHEVTKEWVYSFNLFDSDSTGTYTVIFTDPPAESHAPVLQFIADHIVVEGSELSFVTHATDGDGTIPTLAASPLPSGVHFSDRGDGWGDFSWTPAVGQAGTYQITFAATDGVLSDSQAVSLTVRSIDDTDGDGLPDTWEVLYFGNLSRDGSVDYDGDGVSDRDEYLAGTNPANRAPVLDAIGNKSVAEDAALAFTVTAVDPDGTVPIVTASGLPAGAAFDGAVFSWTPTFDQAGDCAVTFRAWDGEREDLEIVQITVTNVNRTPTVPLIVSPQTQSEVTMTRPSLVVENSVDPDGDPVMYQFEIYANPAMNPEDLEAVSGLVAEQPGTTSWTVGIDLPDNAKHYWRVLASDGTAPSIWADANFFVNTANDPPGAFAGASPADGAVVAVLTPQLRVTNSSDIDGDPVSYSFYVYSDEGLTQLIDSVLGVSAGAGGSTAWTVTVPLADNTWHFWAAVATDGHGLSAAITPQTFFVNTANDAPTIPTVASPADGVEVGSGSVALTVNNAIDLDGNVLTYFFELDTAATFDTPNKVVSGPIAQGGETTLWNVSGLSENTRYYWHCKAADGWVESPWATTAASFFVNATNDAPSAPTLRNPGAGSHVDSVTPRLELFAATDPDLDAVEYEYEVYAQPPGSPVAAWRTAATDWVVAPPLTLYEWYSWRARAVDEHELAGVWMDLTAFFTDNNAIDDPPTITVTEPAAAVVQTGGNFTIAWVDGDPDSDASISLYRDSDGAGMDGTLIVAGLSEDADGPAGSYVWDLTGVPAGTWYVYGVISDANTTGTDYAPGTVTISAVPANLALNKPASASTTRSGTSYTSAKAVDGSTSTSWMSSTTSGAQWVQVDLGSSQSISYVKVAWPATYYAKDFQIQTSTDGNSFTSRYPVTGATGTVTHATFAAVSARYVRVNCTTRNNRSYYGVAELEVYAAAPTNQPPVANAGLDQTGTVGQVLSFSGSGSEDPDGTIVGYSWTWGDGLPDGTGVSPTHAYTTAGAKTVTLTVTDDGGATATDQVVVTVNPAQVNLALNKPASASTTRSGSSYTAAKAVDGSTTTSWMSSTSSSAQWVRVDLGSVMSISKVKVVWPATYYAKSFQIETSTDGTTFISQYPVTGAIGTVTDATFTPVNARYVRIYCTLRKSTSYYGVAELEVYQ